MPYRDIVTDRERPTRFTEVAGMGDMQNRIVLNVSPVPNANPVHVSTDCTLRPHANIVAHNQITQNDSTRIYHHPLAKRWGHAVV